MLKWKTGRLNREVLAAISLTAAVVWLASFRDAPDSDLELVARARISAVYDVEAVLPVGYALERGILRVLDLTESSHITEINSLPFDAPRVRMALRPPRLYLTGFGAPLAVVDVSDPRRPAWIGDVSGLEHTLNDGFDIEGAKGYLLRLDHGLHADAIVPMHLDVLDLDADPPVTLATLPLGIDMRSWDGTGIAVADERVYVSVRRDAEGRSHLLVVDARAPERLEIDFRAVLPPDRVLRDVAVDGGLLYLLQDRPSTGLAIARLAADGLEILGEASGPDFWSPIDLIVNGDVVYATLKGAVNVAAFEVADPRAPRIAFTYGIPDRWAAALGMTLVGDRLFVSGDGGPAPLFDVSTPLRPRLLGQWRFEGGLVGELALDGNLLLVANIGGGLFVYDVADPRRPVRLARRHPPVPESLDGTGARQIWPWENAVVPALHDRLGFVAYVTEPAELLDLSEPAEPRVLATLQPSGLVHAAVLRPPHLFLGYRGWRPDAVPSFWDPNAFSDAGGIEIWDVSVPEAPRRSAELKLAAPVTDLSLGGGQLIAGHPGGGLTLVDVGDASRPTIRGALPRRNSEGRTPIPYRETRVVTAPDRDFAYLVQRATREDRSEWVGSYSLSVVDLRDADTPRVVGSIALGESETLEAAMIVFGDIAVVVAGDIYLVDVAEPSRPRLRGRQPFPPVFGEYAGLAASADHIYVGMGEDGVFVYRVRESIRP